MGKAMLLKPFDHGLLCCISRHEPGHRDFDAPDNLHIPWRLVGPAYKKQSGPMIESRSNRCASGDECAKVLVCMNICICPRSIVLGHLLNELMALAPSREGEENKTLKSDTTKFATVLGCFILEVCRVLADRLVRKVL